MITEEQLREVGLPEKFIPIARRKYYNFEVNGLTKDEEIPDEGYSDKQKEPESNTDSSKYQSDGSLGTQSQALF